MVSTLLGPECQCEKCQNLSWDVGRRHDYKCQSSICKCNIEKFIALVASILNHSEDVNILGVKFDVDNESKEKLTRDEKMGLNAKTPVLTRILKRRKNDTRLCWYNLSSPVTIFTVATLVLNFAQMLILVWSAIIHVMYMSMSFIFTSIVMTLNLGKKRYYCLLSTVDADVACDDPQTGYTSDSAPS